MTPAGGDPAAPRLVAGLRHPAEPRDPLPEGGHPGAAARGRVRVRPVPGGRQLGQEEVTARRVTPQGGSCG